MDIEKPTQRKTVQWNAEEIKINVVEQKENFKKKVLEFQTTKSKMHNEQSDSDSDDDSLEQKSQKTIAMEMNLKKAKVNRISLSPGPVNLNELNRRISTKQNMAPMDQEEEMDEESMARKADFEKKKKQLCKESFGLKKNN